MIVHHLRREEGSKGIFGEEVPAGSHTDHWFPDDDNDDEKSQLNPSIASLCSELAHIVTPLYVDILKLHTMSNAEEADTRVVACGEIIREMSSHLI